MAKTTISAKIDPDRLARLDARVADLGITRTSAIEAAVDAWLSPVRMVSKTSIELADDVDPDQILLDLAAQPPSNPWGI